MSKNIEKVSIKDLKPNKENPRVIRDDKFEKLVNSIKSFPEMMEIRPIVVNNKMVVLGGNQRLKACTEAGLKEVFIIKAGNLTLKQQKEFIIKDNVGFGEWDWNQVGVDWDNQKLEEWGVDIWEDETLLMEEPENLVDEEKKNNKPQMKITFKTPEQLQKAEIEILEILERNYKGAFFSVNAGEI